MTRSDPLKLPPDKAGTAPRSGWVQISRALSQPRQKNKSKGYRTIYALVDPADDCVRYVGMTTMKLAQRLAFHLKRATNDAMRRWFRELRTVNLRPVAVALEYVAEDEWEDAERGWIHWFREHGELLNVDPGGEARTPDGAIRRFIPLEYVPPGGVPKKSGVRIPNGRIVVTAGARTMAKAEKRANRRWLDLYRPMKVVGP